MKEELTEAGDAHVSFDSTKAQVLWRDSLSTGEQTLYDQGLLVEGEVSETTISITGRNGETHKIDVYPYIHKGRTLRIPSTPEARKLHGETSREPKNHI